MKVAIVLAVLVSTGYSVTFDTLCSSNPRNERRLCDSHGCGHYDADRSGRKHKGVDIKCNDGDTVYAPFDVELKGRSLLFSNPSPVQKLINDGVELSGEGLCFKLLAVKPDKYKGFLKKGQRIGTMLPMQKVHKGIISHMHIQMCDRSDPTKYF